MLWIIFVCVLMALAGILAAIIIAERWEQEQARKKRESLLLLEIEADRRKREVMRKILNFASEQN